MLTFSSTKRLGGSRPRLQDCSKLYSQSVTWIPLSEALDNMPLYVENPKQEKEPQDFERFKTAVIQPAGNSAYLTPEQLEEPGHTVCGAASGSCSARGLAHCIARSFFVGGSIQALEGHLLPGILLRQRRGEWYEELRG